MIEIFANQIKEIEYYSNKKNVHFVKVDKNGTHVFADCTCNRCGGTGYLDCYGHVDGGVCFECGGSGVSTATEIKIYTDEYGAKLKAQREAREEKKRQKMIEESDEWNKKWMAKEGFNEEGITYIVLGNTYEIKEELKAHGAKFNYTLGWHMPNAEGYDAVPMNIDQVTYHMYNGRLDYIMYSEIVELVKALKEKAEQELKAKNGEHISEYIGTVGERREFTCKLVGHFCYESNFGGYGYWTDNTMHIYKFKDENGDIVVWNTATYLDDDKPEYKFKATIKEHSEYKGEKQTVISRPKFFTEN